MYLYIIHFIHTQVYMLMNTAYTGSSKFFSASYFSKTVHVIHFKYVNFVYYAQYTLKI
jgi:hypothetical protein